MSAEKIDPTEPTEDNVRSMIGYLHRNSQAASADLLFNLWAAYSRVLLTRPQPLTFPQPVYPMGPGIFSGALPSFIRKFDDGSAEAAVDPCACPDCGSKQEIHDCPADCEDCGELQAANGSHDRCEQHAEPAPAALAPDKCPECMRLQRVERDWGLRCRDHVERKTGTDWLKTSNEDGSDPR